MNDGVYILIPARGGSKRFPNKNMHPFCGKPLLWHSIYFSKMLDLGDKCYVSSDSNTILDYAKVNDVHTILRPDYLSGPNVKISDVAIHFVQELKKKGIEPAFILLLQPTNPLRVKSFFRDMFSILMNSKSDCVFTVHTSKEKLGQSKDGSFTPLNYRFEDQMFSHNTLVCENGTLYLFRVNSLLETNSLFGKHAVPYKIPSYYKYNDIDEETDLLILEFLYTHLIHMNIIKK